MPPPDEVKLGPLTRTVLDQAEWRAGSLYPSCQAWADEAEYLFAFLETQRVFDRFLRRSRVREREMKAALAEARAGFFFHRKGFRILAWEPEEVPGRPGDLDIQWGDTEPIFVEVKGPDWEGELTDAERQGGRRNLPKYINADVHVIAPQKNALYAITKALPKLVERRANLVVVVDNLFVSPLYMTKDYLTLVLANGLADPTCRSVGGVLLLLPVKFDAFAFVDYLKLFVPNSGAAHPLPDAATEELVAEPSANGSPLRW